MRLWSGWMVRVFLAFLVMAPASASATTWIVPEPAAMAQEADAVVLARVDSIRSVASFDGSTIHTEIGLRVIEGMKGARVGERIVLREVGGLVGEDQQWIFGAAEYRVGEIVVAHLQEAEDGTVRTLHMGIGKSTVRISESGEISVARLRAGGRKERVRLAALRGELDRAGVKPLGRRLSQSRMAAASAAAAPLLGRAQANRNFRLLGDPGARWFRAPVQVWGALAGDKKLGRATSNRIVQDAVAAWDEQPGSELDLIYAGERKGPGWVCNDGFISVTFNDPHGQIANPRNCGGGALAIGGFCMTGSPFKGSRYHEIASGSVVVADGWNSCWFWNESNVAEIMTHEIGHTLGFGHSWDGGMGNSNDRFITDATMYWTAHFDGRGASLADYDQGALAWLYDDGSAPAPQPTPTPAPPAPTPEPTPEPEPEPDADGDGHPDERDNCPVDANRTQRDRDRDGVGDACDTCPSVKNPEQAEVCGTLDATVRIAKRKNGTAVMSVRARMAPRADSRAPGEVEIALHGDNHSWEIGVADGKMKSTARGTRSRFRGNRADISLRKFNETTSLVAVRVRKREVAQLAGERLTLEISIGGVRTAVDLKCRTRYPEGRVVTRCDS